MKDCYNLVGTSWEAIYLTGKNEAEQNMHIKEKYDFIKGQLKFKKENPNITQERLEELIQREEQCDIAYERIKTAELRTKYNQERIVEMWKEEKQNEFENLIEMHKQAIDKDQEIRMETQKKVDKYAEFRKQYEQPPVERKKTPYQILDFNPETLSMRSNEENDAMLEERKDKFLEALYQELEACESLIKLDKIVAKIDEIKTAYEQVSNAQKREELMQVEGKKEQEEIQEEPEGERE